ncbi:MAG: ABC transporter ATP-binding protein [Candidatus Dormiibacterota bacterium]
MSEVSVSDLHKAFGETAVLRGLELEAAAGSLTAILGPSGSGKTTLLRLIAGLERADRGKISLAGQLVDDGHNYVRPEGRRIGYVPQDGSLFPHLTVEQNVGFGLSRQARRGDRVASLLKMVGLGRMERRYPHQLSGGQQQRVALARALAIDPQLILLDEPFSALDPSLRAAVREEVRAILAQTGMTTILVTHDQEEALSIADQVAVLRDGVVAQFGTPHQLYHDPIDLEMARFLGDANLVDGVVEGASVTTALGSLALRPAGNGPPAPIGPAVVLLRPEQIVLSSDQGAAGVSGRIVRSEFYGHDSIIDVVCDQLRLGGHIRVRVQGTTRFKEGAQVAVSARGDAQAWPKTA